MKKVISTVKNHFLSGVLVVVPLILTYLVLRFLFESVDSILKPVLLHALGYYIPGLGVVTTILLILLAGVLTRNFLGARLHKLGENILVRVPLIRPVYSAAKQVLEAITQQNVEAFKEVVLIEYPRRGSYQLGFVTNRVAIQRQTTAEEFVAVFVPSTPTPVTGNVVLVPKSDIHQIDLTVEEGIKFIVSAGVSAPTQLRFKFRSLKSNNEEVHT